jgi:adenine-specific DNA-methyltransferase
MRFIGCKTRLLPFIQDALSRRIGGQVDSAGDLFCGTGAVSKLLKRNNVRVTANDNLRFCYVLAKAALGVNSEPPFRALVDSGEAPRLGKEGLFSAPYDKVLAFLNELPGKPGFIFREYSPGGTVNGEFRRSYFTDENAQRIDAIREKISDWEKKGLVNETEACLLIADLIHAANRVANIAGTYGCFIKHWDPRAHKRLTLKRSEIISSPYQHQVFCKDANALAREQYFDVLYLDPPYTWRHYGAYYHILETIARADQPAVVGQTGLRPWEDSKSRYCDRSDAANALEELTRSAQCKHLYLSYNSEGLIEHDEIMSILSLRGRPVCSEIGYRRYRSNNGGNRSKPLKERLYYVQIS